MKYRFALFVLPLLLLTSPPGVGQEKTPSPYYPLKVGSKWHYRVGEDQKVVVTVVKMEEFKIMRDKGKDGPKEEKVPGFVLEIAGGPRSSPLQEKLAVLSDGIYRFSAAGKDITPPLRFLKLPPKKGETWQVDSTSNEKPLKGTFTAGEADIKVPAGTYKTITSSSSDFQIDTQKMSLEYYFAPGVGIVKQHVHVGNFDMTMELEKYEP